MTRGLLALLIAGTLLAACNCRGSAEKLAFIVQPTSTPAGAAIAPAIQVAIQDKNGNTVTSSSESVTLALASNPTHGSLGGTVTVQAVKGIATFDTLSIQEAGSGYTLFATSNGLDATSNAFDIVAGAPARLAFAVQPSNAQAGGMISPAVQVRIEDAYGNLTQSTADVAVSLADNPGGASLNGTTNVAAVAGVATFSELSIAAVANGYSLAATSGSLTSVTSQPFDVTAGPAAALAFLVEPSDAVAGAAISPAVQVQILDAYGNLASGATDAVSLALGANPGGGTLSGTLTANASGGVATFSDLTLDKVAVGYTLTASGAGLTGATSAGFSIVAGAAAALAFATQPASAAAGQTLSSVQVEVLDQLGNRTSSTASVALALASGPPATLNGTTSVAAVAGVATFSDLSITRAGTGYALAATSTGISGATSSTFDIAPGADAKLAYVQQPTSAVAGGTISPAVAVEVQDAYGNRTSSTATLSLALKVNPTGAVLSGMLARAAVAGVATFGDLAVDRAGTGYTIEATSAGLTSVESAPFDVQPGSAVRVAFATQPTDTVAGATISPAVQVEVLDGSGNRVTTSSASITVALGTNPGGGTLSGTTTVAAVAGVATFSNLSIDKVGAGYTLTAASAPLTGTTSTAFNISPAAASKLAFTVQPTDATAGVAIAPAVRVTVQDQFSNTVTSSTASITVAIGTNPGGGTLSGTTTVAAVNGVATFPTLSIDRVGLGYTLTAVSVPLTGATSSAFNITMGGAINVGFITQPSSTTAGAYINNPTGVRVAVQDAFGNTVLISGVPITVAIYTNPSGGTLSGTLTVDTIDGIATFPDLWIDRAGLNYKLSASSPGLSPSYSNFFSIIAGPPSRLAFTTPSRTFTGGCPPPDQVITVQLQDAFGNPAAAPAGGIPFTASSTSTGTVGWFTDSACSNPASGGNFTIAQGSISRDVYYTDTRAGTISISLTNGSGLTNPAPQSHTVNPAAPTRLAFIVQPASTPAGSPISPAVQVAVQDAFGNTDTSSTASITVAIGTNPGGGTLSGTTTVAAVAGVATFSDLFIDQVGTGYTLTAASAPLTGATSSAFNITGGSGGGLVYTDPAPGGQIRLVVNSALSTPTTVVLDLVAAAPLTGYSIGVNLPLDTTRAQANATLLTPGTALPAGSAPIAAAAVIPTTGSLANVLVTGQSQKAAGAGAVTADSTVAAGALFYRLRLDAVAGAPTGVVFDGAALGPKFRAAMRDKLGTDVATAADFRIGRLELF